MGEVVQMQHISKPNRQQRRNPDKHLPIIEESKMNEGGFYDGMPGVVLNEHGHRKMIEFVKTPDNKPAALVYAHDIHIKQCIQAALKSKAVKPIIYGAVIDDLFSNRNPLNWYMKLRFRFMFWRATRRKIRKDKALLNELKKDGEDIQKEERTAAAK